MYILFLMLQQRPRANSTDTLCTYTTLFRSQIGIESFVFAEVKIGHIAEQGRCRRLAVAVDEQDAIAPDREILRQMNRRGALAHAAFEVLDGEDRDRVRWRAPRPRPECSDRKSTRLNSSHQCASRMPASA